MVTLIRISNFLGVALGSDTQSLSQASQRPRAAPLASKHLHFQTEQHQQWVDLDPEAAFSSRQIKDQGRGRSSALLWLHRLCCCWYRLLLCLAERRSFPSLQKVTPCSLAPSLISDSIQLIQVAGCSSCPCLHHWHCPDAPWTLPAALGSLFQCRNTKRKDA